VPEGSPALVAVAGMIAEAARWIKLALETIGAMLIAYGAIAALLRLVRRIAHRDTRVFLADRLVLAQYLAWALEFQLAADILDTAISADWAKIGEVAAIAAIRTALNYSLAHEMKEEQHALDRSGARKSNGGSSAPA